MATTMIGDSPALAEVRRRIDRFAPLRAPVLVSGETGTGKELAARMLHEGSHRQQSPFVAVNCATITGDLAHSVLFGHVRGAYTGATGDRDGVFVAAGTGTVFLDELGELPLLLQAALLRVIEEGRVRPAGADRSTPVQARIVAATHRDLPSMVATGRFREDLLHRLSVLPIEMPSLCDRPGDIPALVAHFCDLAGEELGRPVTLTQDAVEAAVGHRWAGNARALKNAILRAGALTDGPIEAAVLLHARPVPTLPPPPMARTFAPAAPARDHVALPRADYRTMRGALLRDAVTKHGSINRAAKALGVPRSTLSAWLRRMKTA